MRAVTSIRSYLQGHEELLPELADPAAFNKKLWMSYLKANHDLYLDLINKVEQAAVRSSEIETKAGQEHTQWQGARRGTSAQWMGSAVGTGIAFSPCRSDLARCTLNSAMICACFGRLSTTVFGHHHQFTSPVTTGGNPCRAIARGTQAWFELEVQNSQDAQGSA
ncbi:hypothetical protein ACQ859_16405 [Roseateles chitinivorans]|uniref:hypothetical protein n=1 Tax=Roseateles chitinivorans TaxID=2917965 RepID=UPI003D667B3A